MKVPALRLPSLATNLCLGLTILFAATGAFAYPQANNSDVTEIQTLLKNYQTAVDNADVTLASQIWSHDPGVTFIHPRGTDHGFQQIADDVYTNLMGKAFSKRELILHDPAIHIYNDAAWSEMTWTFHATVTNGPDITTEGRETQVYHKENGVWHIVLVHYSGLPVTAALKGF